MNNTPSKSSIDIRSSGNEIGDSDLFYRSLFEYNPDIVFFLDTKGIVAKVNDGFSKILGYTKEQTLLSSMERLIPSSEIPLYRESLNRPFLVKNIIYTFHFSEKREHPLYRF